MNIKANSFIFGLIMFSLCSAQPQNRNNSFTGFSKGYIKASYNYFPSFISSVNDEISAFGLEKFEDRIFLYGVEMCGNMNPSFGIGIQYLNGTDITQKMVSFGDTLKLDRSVSYSMSFVSVFINYRKFLRGPLEFFGSLSGGYGAAKIIISQDYGDQAYEDMWNSYDPGSYLYDYNRSTLYDPGMYVFRAENGIRFYAGSRLSVDLSVGYTYGFVSKRGDINYGFESLKNVPDLDYKGLNYGLGISFGY